MRSKRLLASLCFAAALVIPLTACLGSKGGSPSSSTAISLLGVSPSHLSIPAGGGGYIAVTVTRYLPRAVDLQGPLILALDHAPAGVRGSGSIAADRSTGTLALWVDESVTPRTIEGLCVRAAMGKAVGERGVSASFDLTIAPALPVGQISADRVQASGAPQGGGNLVNIPTAQEPVAATTASDPAHFIVVRHGVSQSTPSN